jgi:multiple sugar transport system permease protein
VQASIDTAAGALDGASPRRGLARRLGLAIRRYPVAFALLLIAPALLLRAFTALWPLISTAWISLHKAGPLIPQQQWVGLANYSDLFRSGVVRGSLGFTLIYTVLSTIGEIVLGTGIALLLNARFRGRGVARAINLIPWAIPVVVTGVGFRFALDPQSGLFAHWANTVLGSNVQWLLERWPARAVLILTNIWRNAPFVAVIVLAALQAISEEVCEAARVDGARGVRQFRHITLPLITPVLVSVSIFFLIWQVSNFDLVLSMTGGGPGESTDVLGYEAYLRGFEGLDFGRSAALSMLLFGFVGVFGLLGMLGLRRAERRL